MSERFPEANGFPPGYEPTSGPGRFVEEVYTEETEISLEAEEIEEGIRSARAMALVVLAILVVLMLVAVGLVWILVTPRPVQ